MLKTGLLNPAVLHLLARITRLEESLNHRDTEMLRQMAGGKTLGLIANDLPNAFDPDFIAGRARPPARRLAQSCLNLPLLNSVPSVPLWFNTGM